MDRDQESLILLGTFHYIVGAFVILGACLAVVALFVGIHVTKMPIDWETFQEIHIVDRVLFQCVVIPFIQLGIRPDAAGLLIILASLPLFVLGFPYGVCLLLAAGSLLRRRRRIFCMVMAAITCVFVPFGTMLGVCTIVVLKRPSLRETFDVAASTSAAGSPSAGS